MKILIISHEYPPVGGGGANACMHLSREYAALGHEVHIVTVWFSGEQEYEERVFSGTGRVCIHRLKSAREHLEHCNFFEMLSFVRKALPAASALARENTYDVCQVFFGIPSGVVGYYLKKKYGLPYIIRFGGGDIPGFQDRFKTVYKLLAPAIKLIWKNADALVANSLGLRKLAENFYSDKEIMIIPNGADLPETETVHNNSTYLSAVRLLFVSRLIERKGLQDIIPQLGSVITQCSTEGIKVTLDIVGDGPYREELERMVNDNNLTQYITFYGQKSKEELPEFYRNADVFVFPSRKEGMPNVVLEAMSYGLPIIMTPCQGSSELIKDNGAVVLPNGFGRKIVEMACNPQMRMEMGRNSIDRIKTCFSWKSVSEQYLDLFTRYDQ